MIANVCVLLLLSFDLSNFWTDEKSGEHLATVTRATNNHHHKQKAKFKSFYF
jgi:hypothetical protein